MSRFAAFLGMALVWGLTWLPVKIAAETVPPILLAAVRFILAGACFYAYAVAVRLPLRPARPGLVVLASLLITTGCYGALFWGLARAPSGLSAILNLALLPVFVIGIGALVGQERITGRRVGAIGLGLVGLALLFSARTGGGGGPEVALGLTAVVAGTLSYAGGAIISRPLMGTMHPVSLAFWETLIGGLALLPVSVVVEGYDPGRLAAFAEPRALGSLLFLVLGGSLLGFSAYLWLVREWGAFRAGLYAFISPLIAVAVGVAWAGEPFGWPEALGMAIMLGATALVIGEPDRVNAS